MRIQEPFRVGITVLWLVTACSPPVTPSPTTRPPTATPTVTEAPTVTASPVATGTPPTTPTIPPRDIVLTAPDPGASVVSPVEVRGRVSVMPFEGTLRGRVYDAQDQIVGEKPIQAQSDVEGDLGGPGSFVGDIPFQVETAGPGKVEIAEISVRDGSIVASATVTVTLTVTPPPDLGEMDVREEWTSTSPDGAWVARGLAAFPEGGAGHRYYTQLTVARSDGSQEWTVIDAWSELALGYTIPQPLRWSSDERYFYYTDQPVPDGCAPFVNGSALQRVDLSDGDVTEVVPSLGLWLALSPDETTLAYVGYGDRGLVLRDLASGRERQTPIEATEDAGDAHLGHVVWSPDGEVLMLTVAIDACGPHEDRRHAIVRVDAGTLSQTTVVPESDRLFITEAWPETDRVLLWDRDGETWWLNPETGDVALSS
jgi:hypothetical protein